MWKRYGGMNSLPSHCAYLHLKYEWKSMCYDWVFINNHDCWPVQEIQCVSQSGRTPSSPLVVKLFEFLWWVGVCIWCSVVLHTPSLLQQQSAQPTILPWWYAQLFLLQGCHIMKPSQTRAYLGHIARTRLLLLRSLCTSSRHCRPSAQTP